jgi:polyisoprenoid-binding protein YceI
MTAIAQKTNTTTWKIDPAHSSIDFSAKHMMISTVRGRLGAVNGEIIVDERNPANSSVDVTVDVAGLTTNEASRDTHLRSADFFDAETYPEATFNSTRVEPLSEDKYRVTGDLTIRGTTKSITFDVEREGEGVDPWGNVKAAFAARTTLNRKDFGLNWNVALEAGGVLVSEKVSLEITVQAAKQVATADSAAA